MAPLTKKVPDPCPGLLGIGL